MKRILPLLLALTALLSCVKEGYPLLSNTSDIGSLKGRVVTTDGGLELTVTEQNVDLPEGDQDRIFVRFDVLRKTGDRSCDIRLNGWTVPLNKAGLRKSDITDPAQVGDDPIYMESGWFSGGYLNMELVLPILRGSETKHLLNLVFDDANSADTLRFRIHHNGFGEVFLPPLPEAEAAKYDFGQAMFCVQMNGFLPADKDEMPVKITWPWYETDSQGYTGAMKDISRKGTYHRFTAN